MRQSMLAALALLLFLLAPGWCAATPRAAATADTTSATKKRVKKTEHRKPRKRGETPVEEESKSKVKDDDDGGWASCFADCLGGLFSGMLSSDDDETTSVVPVADVKAIREPFAAVVDPTNLPASELTLWVVPGGRAAGASKAGTLSAGTEVTVTDRAVFGTVNWVRVVTQETPLTAGWAEESNVIAKPVESADASPDDLAPMPEWQPAPASEGGAEPSDSPTVHAVEAIPGPEARKQSTSLVLDAGIPVFNEGQINDEYLNRAFSLTVSGRAFMAAALEVSAGVSYVHANGEPQYDYVIGSTTESPADSRLNLWGFNASIGQLYPLFSPTVFILWEVGPSLFLLHESADLTIYDGSAETSARTESISAWKGGFRAKIEVGALAGSLPVAGYFSFTTFDWPSNREKSLTFDYLEKDRVSIFGLGVTVGFSSY